MSESLQWAALQSLARDSTTVEVLRVLAASDIDSVLLKGRTTAALLGRPREPRWSCDVDLLVPADQFDRAIVLLADEGFIDLFPGVRETERCVHATTLGRQRDGAVVDLHRSISGATQPAEEVWAVLVQHTESECIGSEQTRILDTPASLMHLAVHAGRHGLRGSRPQLELREALQMHATTDFGIGADLAAQIGALEPFIAGLVLAGAQDLLSELSLGSVLLSQPSRADAFSTRRGVVSVALVVHPPAGQTRVASLIDRLAPSPASMRIQCPSIQGSRARLGAAYLRRLLALTRGFPGAVAEYQRLRRHANG